LINISTRRKSRNIKILNIFISFSRKSQKFPIATFNDSIGIHWYRFRIEINIFEKKQKPLISLGYKRLKSFFCIFKIDGRKRIWVQVQKHMRWNEAIRSKFLYQGLHPEIKRVFEFEKRANPLKRNFIIIFTVNMRDQFEIMFKLHTLKREISSCSFCKKISDLDSLKHISVKSVFVLLCRRSDI